MNNNKIKDVLKNELKDLKNKYNELLDVVVRNINLNIEKSDDLRDIVPALKNDFLNGKFTIDKFIEKLGVIYATTGYEIGITESQKIHDLDLEIEKLEKCLGYLEN